MKKLLLLVGLSIIHVFSIANVAQPGMYNTGYSGRFMPIFPEDRIYFEKIQMQQERVLIDLYPGFAAVKGEYWMYNTTDKPITMTVGYPVNPEYDEDGVGRIMFDDLYQLKVSVNDKAVKTESDAKAPSSGEHQWYTWKTTFAANTVTKIIVYFLTNNSNAGLRKGYDYDEGNAFAYVLESGRAWQGKIEKGEIFIHLKEGVTLDKVKGVLPDSTLKGDDTHLQFSFSNLEPDHSNNILIWYNVENKAKFDFAAVQSKAQQYFAALDNFPVNEFNQQNFQLIHRDNFKVKDTSTKVFWGVILGIGLLVLAAAAGVIFLVYKLVKKLF